MHAVGERPFRGPVVGGAHPPEHRLDRPVRERRLDPEGGAETERRRRIAVAGGPGRAPTKIQSRPWSAALDSP